MGHNRNKSTKIQFQLSPLPTSPQNNSGASKPELGTARLFLWFDPAGTEPDPQNPGVPEVSPTGGQRWLPRAEPLSPRPCRLGITGARAGLLGFFFWGGDTQGCWGQGHGEGTEGNAPGGGGEGGSAARQGVSTERALVVFFFLVGPIKIEFFKMAQKRIP